MAERATENGEGSNKGPVVGMQLGEGHVELCKQLPFEAVEGESLPDAFEHCLIEEEEEEEEEEERLPIVGAVIDTYRFVSYTRADGDVSIVYPPE